MYSGSGAGPEAKKKSTRKSARKSTSTRGSSGGKERAKKLKDIKRTLLERRDEISRGMEHNLDYNDAPPLSRGDASDLAADALDSDTTLQLAERGSNEVAQIEEALNKIDDGTYGICFKCKKPISAARLEAVPHARMCIECKSAEEKGK